jgi:hypothetical protein
MPVPGPGEPGFDEFVKDECAVIAALLRSADADTRANAATRAKDLARIGAKARASIRTSEVARLLRTMAGRSGREGQAASAALREVER